MKLAFLVHSIDGPSTRYRVLQYLPYFKKRGWDTWVFQIPKEFRKRIQLFFSLREYDIIFLQKRLLGNPSRHLLRRNSKILVFDFDDSIMYRDSRKGEFYSTKRRKRFIGMIKMSDIVIAGNDYLKEQAINYNNNIFIVPTPVNMERYKPKIYSQDHFKITLGWIGSSSTLFYLEQIKDYLDHLFIKYSNTQLKIVSDHFISCNKIPVIKKRWDYEKEIEDLHSFDIGLMPLIDDPWSRGKCAFKLLQYMAIGIPAVCSPVGVSKEIIQHGVNGFFAMDESGWLESIGKLIDNADLREEVGKRALETVKEKYALELWASKLLEIFDSFQRY